MGKNVSSNAGFSVIEATISDIHRALRSGNVSCLRLVEAYLNRIEAYDKHTNLNSLVVVNPGALKQAGSWTRSSGGPGSCAHSTASP